MNIYAGNYSFYLEEKELDSILIPEQLSTAKTSYFRPVFETAVELGLIAKNDENKIIKIFISELIFNMPPLRVRGLLGTAFYYIMKN